MKKTLSFALVLGLVACNKNQPDPPTVPDQYKNGVLVLNEGLFEQNNASISFFDGEKSFHQVFKSENGRGLGDTANDFEAFTIGSDEFVIVAVDISSQLEIFNRNTLKSVAQIPLFNSEGNAREPRKVVVQGFTAYVCNFDGTVAVVDLTTATISALIEVGANPDGLVISNDHLYVSNSGGLHYPVYDSTVSVISLSSLVVVETFETRINCTQMVADNASDLYQVSNGNYDDIPPALIRIDALTNTVEAIVEEPISSLVLFNDWMYYYQGDEKAIMRFNTLTEVFDPNVIVDLSHAETFHGFEIDSATNRIYCMDAKGYVNSSIITAYSMEGVYLFDFEAGLVATDLIFNP